MNFGSNDCIVAPRGAGDFADSVDIVVVGAGAAGLVTALAAREAGAGVMVIERDPSPSGSTSLSAGLIPGADSRWQAVEGIKDSASQFTDDIIAKSGCDGDRHLAAVMADQSAPVLHWLADRWQVPLSLVDGFTYPGHSVRRMHGTPSRTGTELLGALLSAASVAGVDLVTGARVSHLFTDNGAVSGVGRLGPDGLEPMGSRRVVLACNGFGGNPEMVSRLIPEMAGALYFGHSGNTGDAIQWAEQLDAGLENLGAYQGHGSVATPHGILISWAVMMEGGFQVNQQGRRFSNEHAGYSEQAVTVLAQPGGEAWNVFDQRIHDMAMQFEDFQQAVQSGAVRRADNPQDLAAQTGLPADELLATWEAVNALADQSAVDTWGRQFDVDRRLVPPLYAVRVQGALFHTQGGLAIDAHARVLNEAGQPITGLYAVGGAARGVSGNSVEGYLSGNGLLAAVTTGFLAGRHAAGIE